MYLTPSTDHRAAMLEGNLYILHYECHFLFSYEKVIMFFSIDMCNIKPVHLFSQLCYLLYLTWYKINGQLSANNPMLIFVRLFPSKSEKAQQFHFLDLITWKGRKTNLFCRVHRCWELKADLKCCSRKYKKDNKTLFYTHDTKINERVIK